jgi:indolepyruvate ferredoxin oxidoreductase alpha subunit
MGVPNVDVIDPVAKSADFEAMLRDRLSKPELSVVIARRNCILAAASIREYEKAAKAAAAPADQCCAGDCGCQSSTVANQS